MSFFIGHLTYICFLFKLKDEKTKYTTMRKKFDAIIKLKPPKHVKDWRSFCGMVNYLSSFLKDLKKNLIPIYEMQ